MPADDFRTELRDILTAFYENILLRPGAGGRPVTKPLIRKFKDKAAPAPEAVEPVAGADADAAVGADAEPPSAAAAPAQAPAPAEAPPTPPAAKRAAKGSTKTGPR